MKDKIIEDYKNTISRLQQECTEKTNAIIALGEQLKAKEQEFEELKKQHESDKGLITSTGKMNYQLIQEYDKLKAENEELKKKCNIYTCGICGNKEDCNKLYKTLTEIKEIVKNMNKECFYNDFDCKDCDMQNGCTYFNKKQILQKISKYEVENDKSN